MHTASKLPGGGCRRGTKGSSVKSAVKSASEALIVDRSRVFTATAAVTSCSPFTEATTASLYDACTLATCNPPLSDYDACHSVCL